MSFPGNIPILVKKLNDYSINEEIVVIFDKHFAFDEPLNNVQTLHLHHPLTFIQSIYHLATSQHIFVDNYYGFLATTNFKENVNCIQVWHAVGAFKKFGLQDKTNGNRTKKARERFKKVYNRFDYIVVGSEKMEQIFKDSFGIKDDRKFLRTGVPRTDFFFDKLSIQKSVDKFNIDFPLAKTRKVILYAPTYREDDLTNNNVSFYLDLDKMYKHFKTDYILLLRLHPSLKNNFTNKYPGFVYNVSDYPSINTLLVGTDILITDYSSIPFEYSLLNKPIIFFTYDLQNYEETRGLQANFKSIIPGPIAYKTEDIIEQIKKNNFNTDNIRRFANKWNEFSQGNSTEELIKKLYKIPLETEQIRKHV